MIKYNAWLKEDKKMSKVMQINIGICVLISDKCGRGNYKAKKFKDIELLEYIGKKDIDNKNIYIGDIVEIYYKDNDLYTVVVIDRDEYGSYIGVGNLKGCSDNTLRYLLRDDKYMKKVGNKYEDIDKLPAIIEDDSFF